MNIYGECRTAIANKPKNFAKLFTVTYYKKINNTNIYCTNNNFKFRLVTGQCVKEFGFKTNKKKYSLVDLTPDIQGIEVVMNNNLDGTLTCYARHNGYYSSIVTQVTQCDGLGFIDFINLDNFDTSKDSLLNIVSSVNTIYDLSFTYQNDWQDLKNSRPTIIKRKGDLISIDLCITGGSDLKENSVIMKLGQDAKPTTIKYGTVLCYDGIQTSMSAIYINTDGELKAYMALPTNKQITGTILYTL